MTNINGTYDIAMNNNLHIINKFKIIEWYVEEGYKFDSYNVFCIEIVDAKLV